MPETEMPLWTQAPRRAPIARGLAWLVAIALPLLASAPALGAQEQPDARVAWVRGEHVYIAAPDSLALTAYQRVSFVMKKKTLASGEIERMVDRGMAIARLTSGSLAGVKKLDRVRVVAEPFVAPRLMRVGGPSERRSHLFFACESITVAPPPGVAAWRVDGTRPVFRMIRGAADPASTPWPETLLVRLFDDVADQEIALERGDLDIAVFWPGELSTRMRNDPRWKERLPAPLAVGLVGTIPGSDAAFSCAVARRTAEDFQALGRSLLRGDLEVSNGRAASCADTAGRTDTRVRYEIEPTCYGRATIDRLLNRDFSNLAPGATVRVSCLDPRTIAAEDVVSAVAVAQVVCAPPFAASVRALGAGALVQLMDCIPPGRQP